MAPLDFETVLEDSFKIQLEVSSIATSDSIVVVGHLTGNISVYPLVDVTPKRDSNNLDDQHASQYTLGKPRVFKSITTVPITHVILSNDDKISVETGSKVSSVILEEAMGYPMVTLEGGLLFVALCDKTYVYKDNVLVGALPHSMLAVTAIAARVVGSDILVVVGNEVGRLHIASASLQGDCLVEKPLDEKKRCPINTHVRTPIKAVSFLKGASALVTLHECGHMLGHALNDEGFDNEKKTQFSLVSNRQDELWSAVTVDEENVVFVAGNGCIRGLSQSSIPLRLEATKSDLRKEGDRIQPSRFFTAGVSALSAVPQSAQDLAQFAPWQLAISASRNVLVGTNGQTYTVFKLGSVLAEEAGRRAETARAEESARLAREAETLAQAQAAAAAEQAAAAAAAAATTAPQENGDLFGDETMA